MVTGSTSGFGKAIAIKFAKNGYDIIITGRRKERLIELEKELLALGGIRVLGLNFDVRNRNEVAEVIYFCATLPEHVNINDLVIMPTAQASANHYYRKL